MPWASVVYPGLQQGFLLVALKEGFEPHKVKCALSSPSRLVTQSLKNMTLRPFGGQFTLGFEGFQKGGGQAVDILYGMDGSCLGPSIWIRPPSSCQNFRADVWLHLWSSWVDLSP